jgi:hypothetical protein
MARLKKAPRRLTRKQQIDAALKPLGLSRKRFRLPALSQDEREQCCMHIGELADTMASVRADAERPRPTRATYRAALAALKRQENQRSSRCSWRRRGISRHAASPQRSASRRH